MFIKGIGHVPDTEIEFSAVRASGPGGQNVNKVSTAVHLRFDIRGSSLPEHLKGKLLSIADRRLTADGVIVIKARRKRTQSQNRQDALDRLRQILEEAAAPTVPRKKTKPSKAAKKRRLQEKAHRSRAKQLRRKVDPQGE